MNTFLFLTIKCNTTAIIKEYMFHVFDPHSRDSRGKMKVDGTAVLTSYADTQSLISFLETFAEYLGDTECVPFEGTTVNLTEMKNISDSEFEGFSEMSDGEYSCILQIIKENEESEIQKIIGSCGPESSSEGSNNSCSGNDMSHDDLADEDIPLAMWSKHLKKNNEKDVTSESETYSSGSEYIPTKSERKILIDSYTESEISSADEEERLMKIISDQKQKRRKTNVRKKESEIFL